MEEITQPTPQTPPPPKQVSPILTWVLLFILGIVVGLALDKTMLLSTIRIPYLGATPTPTLLPTPSPTPDPTANWKTYTNTQFQYSFKYPASYEHLVTQTSSGLNMGCGCEFFSWFDVESTSTGLSAQSWWKESGLQWFNGATTSNGVYRPDAYKIITTEEKKIGQNQALIIDARTATPSAVVSPKPWQAVSAIPFKVYLLKNTNNLVIFTLYETGDQTIFDQILSTFKFIQNAPMDTSTWKIYTTSKGDFSFKYPANLSPIELNVNDPHFYNTHDEAIASASCITNRAGTLLNPCGMGLLAVYPTRIETSKLDSTDKRIAYSYIDNQHRTWTVVRPVYGEGGTSTQAEITSDHIYHIDISIYDSFMEGQTNEDIQKQIEFINQLLSTVTFTQ